MITHLASRSSMSQATRVLVKATEWMLSEGWCKVQIVRVVGRNLETSGRRLEIKVTLLCKVHLGLLRWRSLAEKGLER